MDIFCTKNIVISFVYLNKKIFLRIINMILCQWNLYFWSDFHLLIFKIKHHWDIIIDSPHHMWNNRFPVFSLVSFSHGKILQNYSAMSQPGYRHWHSHDIEQFSSTRILPRRFYGIPTLQLPYHLFYPYHLAIIYLVSLSLILSFQ